VSGGYLAFPCPVKGRHVVSATKIAFSYSLSGKTCGLLIFQEGMRRLLELVTCQKTSAGSQCKELGNWFVRGCWILAGPL